MRALTLSLISVVFPSIEFPLQNLKSTLATVAESLNDCRNLERVFEIFPVAMTQNYLDLLRLSAMLCVVNHMFFESFVSVSFCEYFCFVNLL